MAGYRYGTMGGQIVVWIPWILAEASLGLVEVQLWPDGGLWLVVIWTAVLLVFRGMVSLASERRARLLFDLLFGGFCVLAAFEGGWFVLPAVAAFALCDLAGLRIRLPAIPHDALGREVRLAVAATFAGLMGFAIAMSGPLYATATSAIEPDGSVVTTQSPAPLLQTGVSPLLGLLLVVVALLFVAVTLTAAAHLATRRLAAWLALLASTFLLLTAVVLTLIMLGPSMLWLGPGVALAVVATGSTMPANPWRLRSA